MDQPYRPVVDALLGVQFFPAANPVPFDDTGWSLPLLRNVKALPIDDKSVLGAAMTLMTADATVPGTITGSGKVLIVDHNADNRLVTFRFAHPQVRMQAAESPFEAAGRTFPAGAFILADVSPDTVAASIRDLGLSAYAVPEVPKVAMHDLDVPRVVLVHSWLRAQDEGWVRLALDTFRVPYTYIGEDKLRRGDLRASYDVIVLPHIGGTPQEQVNGIPLIGEPIPYKKSDLTPNLGVLDSTDDVRGGMGLEGVRNLARFASDGGTLIVEGATSTILPAYGVTTGVVVEEPGPLREGIGAEGPGRRQGEPNRLRLRRRRAGRVPQPGAGAERRLGRRRSRGGAEDSRRGTEPDAERREAPAHHARAEGSRQGPTDRACQ